jgi:hypothetical protein
MKPRNKEITYIDNDFILWVYGEVPYKQGCDLGVGIMSIP